MQCKPGQRCAGEGVSPSCRLTTAGTNVCRSAALRRVAPIVTQAPASQDPLMSSGSDLPSRVACDAAGSVPASSLPPAVCKGVAFPPGASGGYVPPRSRSRSRQKLPEQPPAAGHKGDLRGVGGGSKPLRAEKRGVKHLQSSSAALNAVLNDCISARVRGVKRSRVRVKHL
jgi:hypothetical protein